MLAAITTGVTTVIGYVGNIIKAITGTAAAEGGGIDGAWCMTSMASSLTSLLQA